MNINQSVKEVFTIIFSLALCLLIWAVQLIFPIAIVVGLVLIIESCN